MFYSTTEKDTQRKILTSAERVSGRSSRVECRVRSDVTLMDTGYLSLEVLIDSN